MAFRFRLFEAIVIFHLKLKVHVHYDRSLFRFVHCLARRADRNPECASVPPSPPMISRGRFVPRGFHLRPHDGPRDVVQTKGSEIEKTYFNSKHMSCLHEELMNSMTSSSASLRAVEGISS